MRESAQAQGNCDSEEHQASTRRVHVSSFGLSGRWRSGFMSKDHRRTCVVSSLLSCFGVAVNTPVALRSLSSQALHLTGIINAVVLAK